MALQDSRPVAVQLRMLEVFTCQEAYTAGLNESVSEGRRQATEVMMFLVRNGKFMHSYACGLAVEISTKAPLGYYLHPSPSQLRLIFGSRFFPWVAQGLYLKNLHPLDINPFTPKLIMQVLPTIQEENG